MEDPEVIDIQNIINIAKQAGDIIMSYYNHQEVSVDYKSDSSPVTKADLAANEFIFQSLSKLYPSIPVISEENLVNDHFDSNIFWSVDPLDATKSFIDRVGEFTVNIGLIIDSRATLGVVYAPLSKQLYYVGEDNIPYKQLGNQASVVISTRDVPETGLVILTSSRSNNQEKLNIYLGGKKVDKIIPMSSAIKICMIAEGLGDLYPRFGRTMEWDTAAAHAILTAAGGSIKDLKGNELTYGRIEDQYYNPEFIACGV